MLMYCANLFSALFVVKEALSEPKQTDLHDLKLGDWVVVKNFRKKRWKAKRWLGTFLLTTQTVVKVATWIHASHCK